MSVSVTVRKRVMIKMYIKYTCVVNDHKLHDHTLASILSVLSESKKCLFIVILTFMCKFKIFGEPPPWLYYRL